MNKVLESFAVSARIDGEDATQIARKYLAVHVSLVPTQLSYAMIASDYQALDIRTPLAHYATQCPDPATFVQLMQTSEYTGCKTLSHFVSAVFPQQISWKRAIDKSMDWKNNAFFLALNARGSPRFRDLIKAIDASNNNSNNNTTSNDNNSKSSNNNYLDIANAMIKYQFAPTTHEQELAVDIGRIIATVSLDSSADSAYIIADEVPVDSPLLVAGRWLDTNDEGKKSIESLECDLEGYRKRALLPPTIPTLKIAKQFVLAYMNADIKSIPPSVLVRHQKQLTKPDDMRLLSEIIRTREFQSIKEHLKFEESPTCVALASALGNLLVCYS